MNSNLNYYTVYNLSYHGYKYSNMARWSLRGENFHIWGPLDCATYSDISVAPKSTCNTMSCRMLMFLHRL